MPFVGALYGWPTVVGGWVVHLLHSVFAGLLFAFVVSRPVFHGQIASVGESVAAGVVFAAAIGLLSTGLLLPVSMSALGIQSFTEPLVPLPGLLGNFLVVASPISCTACCSARPTPRSGRATTRSAWRAGPDSGRRAVGRRARSRRVAAFVAAGRRRWVSKRNPC
ncbi:hypothetical protein [Haloarcula sp. Atlit-47R]|uniref:hypothetical protein n=1 Tax=Haloarcula sp. Atlit-47R TaxID=2282132 RepID=UPI001F1F94A7|nr:hypothetical protein [Haloarcula sp. Atlit-47R]